VTAVIRAYAPRRSYERRTPHHHGYGDDLVPGMI